MSGITGTDWDDEMFTDRVNVVRSVKAKNPSGQSVPVPTTIYSDVPCKIQRFGVAEDVGVVTDQVVDRVQVGFPYDVTVSVGDILVLRSPSVGSNIRVGSYAFDTTLNFGLVVGTQTT